MLGVDKHDSYQYFFTSVHPSIQTDIKICYNLYTYLLNTINCVQFAT